MDVRGRRVARPQLEARRRSLEPSAAAAALVAAASAAATLVAAGTNLAWSVFWRVIIIEAVAIGDETIVDGATAGRWVAIVAGGEAGGRAAAVAGVEARVAAVCIEGRILQNKNNDSMYQSQKFEISG